MIQNKNSLTLYGNLCYHIFVEEINMEVINESSSN